ncbi:MAG: sugar transferase, partial [Muribaculaceae bacterium]|nr:sugar transferase [Muribaculaceae bacterium]
MIGVKRQTAKYVICDYVMSNIAWLLFNIVRFYMPVVASGYVELDNFLLSKNVLIGQLFMPLIMMMVYYLSGYYNITFFKSRLQELF